MAPIDVQAVSCMTTTTTTSHIVNNARKDISSMMVFASKIWFVQNKDMHLTQSRNIVSAATLIIVLDAKSSLF